MKKKKLTNFLDLSQIDKLSVNEKEQVVGGVLWPIVYLPVDPVDPVDPVAVKQ